MFCRILNWFRLRFKPIGILWEHGALFGIGSDWGWIFFSVHGMWWCLWLYVQQYICLTIYIRIIFQCIKLYWVCLGMGIKAMSLNLFVHLHQFCIDGVNVAAERCSIGCWRLIVSCRFSMFLDVAFFRRLNSVCNVVCRSWKWSGSLSYLCHDWQYIMSDSLP